MTTWTEGGALDVCPDCGDYEITEPATVHSDAAEYVDMLGELALHVGQLHMAAITTRSLEHYARWCVARDAMIRAEALLLEVQALTAPSP